MDDAQRGNFIAWYDRSREAGSNQPHFTGRLSIPGREDEHELGVWTGKDRLKRPYFYGSIDGLPITGDALAQVDQLASEEDLTAEAMDAGYDIKLAPRQFVMFANRFREPNSADTPEEAEKRSRQNHFWGRLNPGDGSPVVALAMWVKQDRNKKPMLTGSTEYPRPGRDSQISEQEPSVDELMAPRSGKGCRKEAEGRA